MKKPEGFLSALFDEHSGSPRSVIEMCVVYMIIFVLIVRAVYKEGGLP